MDLAEALRLHARWTADLTPAQFQRVAGDLALQQVPAGAPVCSKGEPVDAWVGVLDGLVKLTSSGADGKALSFTGVDQASRHHDRKSTLGYRAAKQHENKQAAVPDSTAA